MIELPDFAGLGQVRTTFIDSGFTQSGISSDARIDRKGSRYQLECSYGPYYPHQAAIMESTIIAAKREGIRIAYPLQVPQGGAGNPVMDGGSQTGRLLSIRGLIPHYVCGLFWLSIEHNGKHFLHNVQIGGRANAAGELTVTLNEVLRDNFPDGTKIHLSRPMVEGLIQGDEMPWTTDHNRTTGYSFTFREKR